MDTPRTGPWAFRSRSEWARYLVSLIAVGAVAAATLQFNTTLGYIEGALVILAGLVMVIDRPDFHVFVRAILWGTLAFGGLNTSEVLHEAPTEKWAWLAMTVGSGVALLALGSRGLTSERGGFAPVAMRRSLLTMMVVGLSVAHVFTVTAVVTEMVSHEVLNPMMWTTPATLFARITMFASPVLLVLGVVGLSRTRTWGLLAYLGSLLSVAATIALAFSWADQVGYGAMWVVAMAILWGAGATVALGAALPVLAALVFKRPPASGAPSPAGAIAHAALVTLALGGVAALRLMG